MLANMGLGMRAMMTPLISGPSFDPEAGLALTVALPQGALDAQLDPYNPVDVVFATSAVFPSNPVNGVLFEHGGGGIGHTVLLRNGGSVLRVRAGDGASSYKVNETAILDLTDFPKDDQWHAVVWDVRISAPGRVRLWIDGVFQGEAVTGGNALESNKWSGGGSGGFATGANANVSGEVGQLPWPATVASELRLYANQLVLSEG
ncbi:MAG: hypothetical protein KI792_07795 [Alphaproteobacteria bacterium]|nr:hypothetical protein [Alphaproteobacteria bacterium SS10]